MDRHLNLLFNLTKPRRINSQGCPIMTIYSTVLLEYLCLLIINCMYACSRRRSASEKAKICFPPLPIWCTITWNKCQTRTRHRELRNLVKNQKTIETTCIRYIVSLDWIICKENARHSFRGGSLSRNQELYTIRTCDTWQSPSIC